jgi:hypothetical protein
VLDLAAAEDGEDVRRLGEDIGDCDCWVVELVKLISRERSGV